MIGALGAAATDRPFQPWLNVYDPRDFVAFIAEGVWPGETGIVDHEVDLDIGFPHAHGPTYFMRPDVFPAIFDFLDRLPDRPSTWIRDGQRAVALPPGG